MRINFTMFPASGVNPNRHNWVAFKEGEYSGPGGWSFYAALGQLVAGVLEYHAGKGELAPDKEAELIDKFRTRKPLGEGYYYEYDYYALGQYCYEHAEELGLEFRIKEEVVTYVTREPTEKDLE